MEGEVSVLAQILDKIEALSSELSEVKAQTQQQQRSKFFNPRNLLLVLGGMRR